MLLSVFANLDWNRGSHKVERSVRSYIESFSSFLNIRFLCLFDKVFERNDAFMLSKFYKDPSIFQTIVDTQRGQRKLNLKL